MNVQQYFRVPKGVSAPPVSIGYLDAYPGALRAFSIRRVYSDYTGPLFKAGVTPLGSEFHTDIYPDETGLCDEAQLISLMAESPSGEIFIERFYDQAGGGYNMDNFTSPPRIYDSSGFRLLNGYPALDFGPTSRTLRSVGAPIPSVLNIFYSFEIITTAGQIWHSNGVGGTYGLASNAGSMSTSWRLNYGNPLVYRNKVLQTVTTRGQVYTAVNPRCVVAEIGANISTWGSNRFLGTSSSGFSFSGKVGDWIEFTGSMSESDINGICDLINEPYLFY